MEVIKPGLIFRLTPNNAFKPPNDRVTSDTVKISIILDRFLEFYIF
jgi:hypothetical protein